MNDPLVDVLAFARGVGPVIPLHSVRADGVCSCSNRDCGTPAKHPWEKEWTERSSRDEAVIRAWFKKYPACNWGMVTGPASGIDVLDEDPRNGGDQTIKEFEAAHGPLPETVRVLTQSGGTHRYFKHDPVHPVKCGAGVLGPGVDVKGINGQVVIPPSIGATGRSYHFDLSAHPDDVQIADWTEPLLKRVNGTTAIKPPLDVAEIFAGIPEGYREGKIVSLIGKLRRVDVPEEAALITVLEAAARCVPPFPADEAAERVHRLFATYSPAASDEPEEIENAPDVETSPNTEPEDDETPMLPEVCWRAGFSEFRAAWGHTTESPDAFLWSAFFTATGATLGRGPFVYCSEDIHPNVYVANLGRSGAARKSTGQAKAGRLLAKVDEGITVLRGIGSPEGLIDRLAGEPGRMPRVLVDLGELSTLLRKGKQEATSGLAPLLCSLYDCPPSVSLPNRKNPVEAKDPFLCMIGSTTPDWLRADLTVDDVRGGLAGRFCYFVGTPKAPIPIPPRPDARALSEAERILRAARDRSGTVSERVANPEAAALHSAWYIAERSRAYPNAILDTLAPRLHVFAWKAALMFSMLEGTATITEAQMTAALAFADYQRATQGAIFRAFGKSVLQQTIDRVLAALEKHGPLSHREIVQRVRHVETETVAKAVATVARMRLVEERQDGRKRVLALVGQRFGNASGNASAKRKR